MIDVKRWNAIFGIHYENEFGLNMSFWGDESWVSRRSSFLTEEETEYDTDEAPQDKLDALMDCLWICCGTFVEGGIHPTIVKDELSGSAKQLYDRCLNMRSFLEVAIADFGYGNVSRAWNAVYTANFAKLWSSDNVTESGNANWSYTPVYVDVPGDRQMYVARDEAGKIRKPPGWSPPDYSFFVQN